MSSRIPGFYRLTPPQRLDAVAAVAGLDPAQLGAFAPDGLPLSVADAMIENVVGTFAMPCGVAVNMRMNDEDRLVPMVIEEPSVVAAVSNMARITRAGRGIEAEADDSIMIGQVQVSELGDPNRALAAVQAELPRLRALAGSVHPQMETLGGGVRGMSARLLVYDEPGEVPETMLVVDFTFDCVDAMGANMVNSIAERLSPEIVALTAGRPGLRILSNLADQRLVRASVRLPPARFATHGADPIDGRDVVAGIASAYRFAWADPYRAATHNKGIMNGIDAVAIATGNDWRAIEAGAHAWAARDGRYRPLSSWKVDERGDLVGQLELPMQVGTVGGTIRVHPTVQANLKLAGARGARDLAMLVASVGLIQNLGALRALATEGIQEGHMRMHARSVAIGAGATASEVPAVVDRLVSAHTFTSTAASAVLNRLRAAADHA